MRPPEICLALGIGVLLLLPVALASAPLVSAQVSDEQLDEVTNYIHDCQDNYGGQNFIWWDIKKYWVQNIIWFKLADVFNYTIDPAVYDDFYYMAGELRDLVRDYGVPPPYIEEAVIYDIIQYATIYPNGTSDEPDIPDTPDIPGADPAVWLPIMSSFALIAGLAFIGFNLSRSSRDPMAGLFMLFVGIVVAWSIGWMPSWVFVTAIALIAIASAAVWGKLFGGR